MFPSLVFRSIGAFAPRRRCGSWLCGRLPGVIRFGTSAGKPKSGCASRWVGFPGAAVLRRVACGGRPVSRGPPGGSRGAWVCRSSFSLVLGSSSRVPRGTCCPCGRTQGVHPSGGRVSLALLAAPGACRVVSRSRLPVRRPGWLSRFPPRVCGARCAAGLHLPDRVNWPMRVASAPSTPCARCSPPALDRSRAVAVHLLRVPPEAHVFSSVVHFLRRRVVVHPGAAAAPPVFRAFHGVFTTWSADASRPRPLCRCAVPRVLWPSASRFLRCSR